jgi:predicted aldo/keto reductase-like oxidoreductase
MADFISHHEIGEDMKKETSLSGRRSFLKNGAAGLAGAALLPSFLKSGEKVEAPQTAGKRKMIVRPLGKTGLKLPIVSIGAASYEASLYERALAEGIVHIDTSQYYFNGRHEEMVGRVIAGRKRDSFVVATSVLLGSGAPGTYATFKKEDAARLPEQMEVSLKRLGLDYVDIFYVAGVSDRETALSEAFIAGLQKIKKAGKARFIGLATHQNEAQVIRAAVESKIHDVVLAQWNFRQPRRDDIKQAIAEAAAAGVGIVIMKPMAGAYWDRERKQPINGQAALKWVLQDPNVTTSVPGITSVEQLEADLAIMANPALTPQETADLKLTGEPAAEGLFCAQCGSCASQCPSAADMPTLMRSYMYAYGYKDLGKARGALDQTAPTALSCGDCTVCRVTCTMGFNLKERATDIVRLKALPEDLLGF